MFRRCLPLATFVAAAILVAAAGHGSDAALLTQKSASASPSVKPKPMIARIWHGRTLTAKADEYQKYLNGPGVDKILKAQGNHGVEVLRRADGPRTDFVVISYWESMEFVQRFVKTVVFERDRDFLVEVPPEAVHYEVVRAAGR
jgi:heme-degrading monooxygenase HmoA